MNSGFSASIGIWLIKQLAKFPFWVIYLMSSLFYFLVYYLIGYRKNVVYANLKNSFPEKKEKEIKFISKKFFRHFSDLILEVVKQGEMKKKDFQERMEVKNPEIINRYFERGKSVVVLTMHYNNWEWSSCLPLFMKHKTLGVYKPLHNEKYDRFMNQNRIKVGGEMISNSLVMRHIIKLHQKKKPVFIWLAGDQTPPVFHKYWFRFLNQEAMFYPGPAIISQRFNYPVVFQKIEKKQRGKYETTFEVLFENPENHSITEIMKTYILKMEETIKERPEFYLWSHKRWKNKRPANVPLNE